MIKNNINKSNLDHKNNPRTSNLDSEDKTKHNLKPLNHNMDENIKSDIERFRSLITSYIRDSSVAIVVYDITNRTSFININKWVDDVKSERGNEVIIVIVGNKTDLNNKRSQITTEEGERRAKELKTLFVETSAKTGYNVKTLFKNITQVLPGMENIQDMNSTTMVDINISPRMTNPQQSNCQC
ncbi:hypothetical protein PCK1_000984 [Pneumocystis canis]|nr:hypothetical protein PCK1_000984 [Pneumocystis canis]